MKCVEQTSVYNKFLQSSEEGLLMKMYILEYTLLHFGVYVYVYMSPCVYLCVNLLLENERKHCIKMRFFQNTK
jgi:hypothetical protein